MVEGEGISFFIFLFAVYCKKYEFRFHMVEGEDWF